jgi:hypothetical protein
VSPISARFGAALLLATAVASCADRPPMAMSSQFSPSSSLRELPGERGTCRVRIGAVKDARPQADIASMGQLGFRAVRGGDVAVWLRSGLASLGGDRHLVIVDGAGPADVAFDVELLKAYIMSNALEAKAATVVVRVSYGGADTQLYRGGDAGVNWTEGEGETQSAFDASLTEILKQMRADIVTRCPKG